MDTGERNEVWHQHQNDESKQSLLPPVGNAALSPASHIYQGAWQCTHCDLPLLLNHLYRQAGWKRTLQVRHCRRGSWPLVALMTL